jgi:hypothetical protein
MFTTFHGTLGQVAGDGDGKAKANRPRRSQVRRACDWCKLMRIKCDTRRPCSNCRHADRDCATSGENQFRSMAEAVEEVKRLRTKVRELESTGGGSPPDEAKKDGQDKKGHDSESNGSRPSLKTLSTTSSLDISRLRLSSYASRNGLTIGSVFYGVTSLPYFLSRMGHFLKTKRHSHPVDVDLDLGIRSFNSPNPRGEDHFLSQEQESHSIDIFWQTFYYSYPIFDEGQVRGQFRSLWAKVEPGALRESSPLIDIVVALCIQFSSHMSARHIVMPHGMDSAGSSPSSSGEATPLMAGFQYYQRCQDALDLALESPTLTTVQCYILSMLYLYQAGLWNRAQVVSGKAMMMAMMMRLQDEPPMTDPEPLREMARRTWWSLYTLDAILSVEIGRPPMVGPTNPTCSLPSDTDDAAQWINPHYAYDLSCTTTWLSYQTQTLRLLDVVTMARNVLYTRYDSLVGDGGFEVFINNPGAREESAQLLSEQLKEFNAWAKQVPVKFQVARRDGGVPFSTDCSSIDFNPIVPLHSQRQRLLLELQYHQYCMHLCQLFICFGKTGDMSTPAADNMASAALTHSMTFTGMVHQTLTTSEALNGVYQAFRWQKNALFTMIGYAYTFPTGATSSVRTYIEMGLSVLDMYRDFLPEAGPVVAMARVLANDVYGNSAAYTGSYAGHPYSRTPSLPNSLPTLIQTSSHASRSTVSSGTPISATPIMAATPMAMSGSALSHSAGVPPSAGPMLCNESFIKPEFGPVLINDNLLDMDFFHGGMLGEETVVSDPSDMLWLTAGSLDPWGPL